MFDTIKTLRRGNNQNYNFYMFFVFSEITKHEFYNKRIKKLNKIRNK